MLHEPNWRRFPMHQSTHSTQVFSMFGGGYVPEQRSTDEMPGNLAASDIDEAVTSLTALMFSEVLRSLRSALSVKSSGTA
jgi:hypothetical protein